MRLHVGLLAAVFLLSIFFPLLCSFPLASLLPPAVLPRSSLLPRQGASPCSSMTAAQHAFQLHMPEVCCPSCILVFPGIYMSHATIKALSCWRYSNITVFGETAHLYGTAKLRDAWEISTLTQMHSVQFQVGHHKLRKVAQAFPCKNTTNWCIQMWYIGQIVQESNDSTLPHVTAEALL